MQIGTYIRIILNKKNMTQQALVDKMNELGLHQKGRIITKQRISNILNGIETISAQRARAIEIALELPKYELVKIVGFPTTASGKRELEEIERGAK